MLFKDFIHLVDSHTIICIDENIYISARVHNQEHLFFEDFEVGGFWATGDNAISLYLPQSTKADYDAYNKAINDLFEYRKNKGLDPYDYR